VQVLNLKKEFLTFEWSITGDKKANVLWVFNLLLFLCYLYALIRVEDRLFLPGI
jgi:hypothetical protein